MKGRGQKRENYHRAEFPGKRILSERWSWGIHLGSGHLWGLGEKDEPAQGGGKEWVGGWVEVPGPGGRLKSRYR